MINEVASKFFHEMINLWKRPEESPKEKKWWLIINAKPIYAFFTEEDKFKAEVKKQRLKQANSFA